MKYAIAAFAALLIPTAAVYAAIHTTGQRDSVVELCQAVQTQSDGNQATELVRKSTTLSPDDKDYIYDMCYAYNQGRRDEIARLNKGV
jgi:Flp pilus assembly protein TadD